MHIQKQQVNTPVTPSFTRAPIGLIQRKCACGTHKIGGECEACGTKGLELKRRGVGNRSESSGVRSIGNDAMRSIGQSPGPVGRAFVESPVEYDLSHIPVQTKLTIGTSGDKYEQEADRIADQVLHHTPGPTAPKETGVPQRVESSFTEPSRPSCYHGSREGNPEQIQIMTKGIGGGSCDSVAAGGEEEETEEKTTIMPKLSAGEYHKPSDSLGKNLALTRGGGNPLPKNTRFFMESGFGHDFGSIRVHTDHRADLMTRQLNAEAFTTGQDIYFKAGRYDPLSNTGKRLLAHELAHVVQQGAHSLAEGNSSINSRVGHDHIQRFTLKGFPATEEAAMKAAVPAAVSKVKSCSKLSWYGKRDIPIALNSVRYDYVPELGLCGWTFPTSWYIEVGKDAFNPGTCCDLPSTLAHEAAHTVFYTESRARKMECNCFGCSC